jgi:hypothetical protein
MRTQNRSQGVNEAYDQSCGGRRLQGRDRPLQRDEVLFRLRGLLPGADLRLRQGLTDRHRLPPFIDENFPRVERALYASLSEKR